MKLSLKLGEEMDQWFKWLGLRASQRTQSPVEDKKFNYLGIFIFDLFLFFLFTDSIIACVFVLKQHSDVITVKVIMCLLIMNFFFF